MSKWKGFVLISGLLLALAVSGPVTLGQEPAVPAEEPRQTESKKRFSLYVSVRSNKSRFQGGRGIEGIGMIPHETVPYVAEDLANGEDTLIQRAEAILAKFPKGKVPYRPENHGWKPPG